MCNFNIKVFAKVLAHPSCIVGVCIFLFCCSCENRGVVQNDTESYLKPLDTLFFNYSSNTDKSGSEYLDNRYGYRIVGLPDGSFKYYSIDSDNQFHEFDFKTSTHTYSENRFQGEIDAYLIDTTEVYLLSGNWLYVLDYQLTIIDSFFYSTPHVPHEKYGIDFSLESGSNLYRVDDYFVLLYYVVDELEDGTGLYRNTDSLFYFFNADTAFFTGRGCAERDTAFQYFRYPCIAVNNGFIFHSPKMLNCIAKSDENSTILSRKIDTVRKNYLSFRHSDQYQMSKLKRYRFSSDYNRELVIDQGRMFLFTQIPEKIYYKENVRKYEHIFQLNEFDENLVLKKTSYIKHDSYSFSYLNDDTLYLFNKFKNRAVLYEL